MLSCFQENTVVSSSTIETYHIIFSCVQVLCLGAAALKQRRLGGFGHSSHFYHCFGRHRWHDRNDGEAYFNGINPI